MNRHLVERSGDLKGELVKYASSPAMAKEFDPARRRYLLEGGGKDGETVTFLDGFVMGHVCEDERTFLEHFVAAHPDLPEDEQEMLLGWQDNLISVFEVLRNDGTFLHAENLVDELTYRITSNNGPKVLSHFPAGTFVMTRIAPVEDFWIFSGGQSLYTPRQSRTAYEMALQISAKMPEMVFRNPKKREEGFAMQEEDYNHFVAFFGTDTLVLRPEEFKERMQAFLHYKTFTVRGEDGKTVSERVQADGNPMPKLPVTPMPEWDEPVQTIGVLHDRREGMEFVPDLGFLAEAFLDPGLVKKEPYRSCVMQYVESPHLTPLAVLRFARDNAENASQVIRALYKDRNFDWERDGEDFLQQFKPPVDPDKQNPYITPISGKLSRKLREPIKDVAPPAMGRNAPCPCGSGQKYKKCCGK